MKRKSIFALLLVVTMIATCFVMQAVSVSAAGEGEKIAYAEKESTEVIADFTDMTKVTGTWDNGIERKFDGNKLIISNDVSGNINGLIVTGVEPGTYKVGYFYDIKAIKDAEDAPEDISGMQDWRMRLNPYATYLNLPYYSCEFDNIEFEGLSTVVGKKIIAIAVIEVLENGDIELLSHVSNMPVTVDGETYSNFIDGTLDRIVFAGADYDFGPVNYPDYEVFIEQAPHEGEEERKAYEDDWTESNAEIPSTAEPTVEPTAEPTVEPTVEPTAEPTVEPTEEPTTTPEATETPATTAPASSATATPADGNSEDGINPVIIVVIVVVVAAIIAGVVVVMKKKK